MQRLHSPSRNYFRIVHRAECDYLLDGFDNFQVGKE